MVTLNKVAEEKVSLNKRLTQP